MRDATFSQRGREGMAGVRDENQISCQIALSPMGSGTCGTSGTPSPRSTDARDDQNRTTDPHPQEVGGPGTDQAEGARAERAPAI